MIGKGLIKGIGHTFTSPIKSIKTHPVRTLAIGAVVFLGVDYLISAKGRSYASQLANKVMPSGGARRLAGHPAPKVLPAGAASAQRAAAAGYFAGAPFGPGWGRGFMPYQYGSNFPETPFDVSAAHRQWAASAGNYPEFWTQSSYPWS
jgi:hypothetical protein